MENNLRNINDKHFKIDLQDSDFTNKQVINYKKDNEAM